LDLNLACTAGLYLSLARVAGPDPLKVKTIFCLIEFYKGKDVFFSLGCVWQTLPTDFPTMFIFLFFVFFSNKPQQNSKNSEKNSRIILKLFLGPLLVFQSIVLIIFGL